MLNKALKYVRIFHHINQVELSERLNISRSYLSEIESGKKKVSLELLDKYAETFNIPASSLLLFSEQLESGSFPEKGRIYMARKILKIMEWLTEKDNFDGKEG